MILCNLRVFFKQSDPGSNFLSKLNYSLTKEQRQYSGAKTVFPTNGAGTARHHMQKMNSRHRPYKHHINKFKIGHT